MQAAGGGAPPRRRAAASACNTAPPPDSARSVVSLTVVLTLPEELAAFLGAGAAGELVALVNQALAAATPQLDAFGGLLANCSKSLDSARVLSGGPAVAYAPPGPLPLGLLPARVSTVGIAVGVVMGAMGLFAIAMVWLYCVPKVAAPGPKLALRGAFAVQ